MICLISRLFRSLYFEKLSEPKIRKQFLQIKKLSGQGNRGSKFELNILSAVRLTHLRSLELERAVAVGSLKKVDIFFPTLHIGFELLAPTRQAVPIVRVEEGEPLPDASVFDNSIRYSASQGETLATLINSKCSDKEFRLLNFPVVLLFDLTNSDIFEDYFHDTPEIRFQRIAADFGTFLQAQNLSDQRRTNNYWRDCSQVGLALVDMSDASCPRFRIISHPNGRLGDEAIRSALHRAFIGKII